MKRWPRSSDTVPSKIPGEGSSYTSLHLTLGLCLALFFLWVTYLLVEFQKCLTFITLSTYRCEISKIDYSAKEWPQGFLGACPHLILAPNGNVLFTRQQPGARGVKWLVSFSWSHSERPKTKSPKHALSLYSIPTLIRRESESLIQSGEIPLWGTYLP